jgi:hypothetical protein
MRQAMVLVSRNCVLPKKRAIATIERKRGLDDQAEVGAVAKREQERD